MSTTARLRSLWQGKYRPKQAKAPRKKPRSRLYVEDLEERTLLSTFYVSPTGNDSNNGLSSASAWQTIARVNQQAAAGLQPGQQILFQGGATFSGNLALGSQDSGAAGNPVTIGTYGSGAATLSAGTGTGLLVNGASYVAISNLVLVGSSSSPAASNGIYVEGSGSNVSIDRVDASGFGGLGIDFNVNTSDQHTNIGYGQSGGTYSNESITNSAAHDNGVGGVGAHTTTDLYVGHVQAYHNAGGVVYQSGYGIAGNTCSHMVVEYSEAYNNGWLPGNLGLMGGIEALGGDHAFFQYNRAIAQRFSLDSEGSLP
jgi:hypothetical protein